MYKKKILRTCVIFFSLLSRFLLFILVCISFFSFGQVDNSSELQKKLDSPNSFIPIVVNQINTLNQMGVMAKEPTDTDTLCNYFLKGASTTECSIISSYPRREGTLLSFEGGPSAGFCDAHWSSIKMKKGDFNVCGSGEDRFSKTYKVPNQIDLEKKGLISLTSSFSKKISIEEKEKKIKDLFAKANEAQKEVSHICCQGNAECWKAMAKTQIKMCGSPEDPTAEDYCTGGAYFSVTADEYNYLHKALYELYVADKAKFSKLQSPEIKAIQFEIQKYGDDIKNYKSDKSLNFTPPVAGRVILSSYINLNSKADIFNSTEYADNLNHEFFHACDNIRTQLQLLNPNQSPKAALLSYVRIQQRSLVNIEDKCDFSEDKLRQYYTQLWQEIGESSDLAQCIERAIKESAKTNSAHYCKDLCRNAQYSEAFAFGGELLTFDERKFPGIYPRMTCLGQQDQNHPFSPIECLAQHSVRFRNNFRKVFFCGTK